MSTPMKHGWRMGGQVMRTCTSLAPASRSMRTSGPVVLPRTMLSSINTTRRSSTFSTTTLYLSITPILRSESVGSMKVRPM